MQETKPVITIIPANQELIKKGVAQRQLRVAAYCRVSTDDEEQLTSYEAQQTYYTDKIMNNPNWTMAGLFADRGITGTSARKRPEFLRMIKLCQRKKVDVVLTKSISRFARNTVDCLKYVRMLKDLGIAIIFEKENINTLESDSEMLITMLGAFAQAESESISANVKWGQRQAMKEGKVRFNFSLMYAYKKGADGEPEIIPEEAEIVREIYRKFLAGYSFTMLTSWLNDSGIPNASGKAEWTYPALRYILTNEKYCGDVLLQKTFIADCITHKAVKNTGQLPKYYIQNHHKGIVDRETFDAVQAEIARRNAIKSPSKKYAPTGKSSYTAKYVLSDRCVCGECGTLYRRVTWTRKSQKRIVWRCVSRLDYGKKYCHESPTIDEDRLKKSILAAINKTIGKAQVLDVMKTALERTMLPSADLSIAEINRKLEELDDRTREIVMESATAGGYDEYADELKQIVNEAKELKKRREEIERERQGKVTASNAFDTAMREIESASLELTEWDEITIRQLVETVRIVSKEKIEVTLKNGIKLEQELLD